MAARRLIAILIVLMLVSTFAAALAPRQERSEDAESEADTTTAAATPPAPSGELVEAVIPARPEQPEVVDAKPGDQVRLIVRVADPQPVSIARLGLTSFATPDDPARFDVLVRDMHPANIEVGEGGQRSVVGRIGAG